MKRSPFPGMDPFIEKHRWRNFHLSFLARCKDFLAVQLPERYVIFAEENVIAKDLIFGKRNDYVPDLGIIESDGFNEVDFPNSRIAEVTPPQATLSVTEIKQRTLTIRDVESNELVTAIELLSPTNKKGEIDQYRRKRQNLLRNQVNLVEIDLLRGGKSAVPLDQIKVKTYQVRSTDAVNRLMQFWTVGLDEKLPTVSVPLLPEDGALVLNLQELFEKEYELSMYSRSIIYRIDELQPKATGEEKDIINKILSRVQSPR